MERTEQPRWEFHADDFSRTEVGRLFVNSNGRLEFTGNLEESARIFFEELGRRMIDLRLERFAAEIERLQRQLKSTWVTCSVCGKEWVQHG